MIKIILLVIYSNASGINEICPVQTEEIQKFELKNTENIIKPVSKKHTSFLSALIQKCTFSKKKKSGRKSETFADQNSEKIKQNEAQNEYKAVAETSETRLLVPELAKSVDEYRAVTSQLSDIFKSKSQDSKYAPNSTEKIYSFSKNVKLADKEKSEIVTVNPIDFYGQENQDNKNAAKTTESIIFDSKIVKKADQNTFNTILRSTKESKSESFDFLSKMSNTSRKRRKARKAPKAQEVKSTNPFDS